LRRFLARRRFCDTLWALPKGRPKIEHELSYSAFDEPSAFVANQNRFINVAAGRPVLSVGAFFQRSLPLSRSIADIAPCFVLCSTVYSTI
jgi:hypothetical protein